MRIKNINNSIPAKLFHKMHYSKLSVIPKNWEKSNADWKKKWRIYYTFYEPGKPPKQVAIRGMNRSSSLKEKQRITRALIGDETEALKTGYNPNKKEIITTEQPHTLESALLFALEKKKLEAETKRVVKAYLNKSLAAAKKLSYHNLPITEIERKHIVDILDDFPDKIYNECRARLKLLFKELVKRQIIKFNPVDEFVEPIKVVRKLRVPLTKEDRKPLHSLKETNYTFWRFLNIFFHSSRRITEMIAVKKEHVDLKNQKFQVLHKKGRVRAWVWITIEDKALSFWMEIMSEANEGDYLFAEDLRPGRREHPIRTDQIKRRWTVHVQKKFGIRGGIYRLKYSHLEEIAAELGIGEAQKSAGHSTPIITMRYLAGEPEREHNRRKEYRGEL